MPVHAIPLPDSSITVETDALQGRENIIKWLLEASVSRGFGVQRGTLATGEPCLFIRGSDNVAEFSLPDAAALGRILLTVMKTVKCTDDGIDAAYRKAGEMLAEVARVN